MKNKKLKAILSISGYFLLVVAICFSAALIFHARYYELIYVSGLSMTPTLHGGDNDDSSVATAGTVVDFGILDTHDSAKKNIKRFSIVSTYYPDSRDYDLSTNELKYDARQKIKRVIALPGETFKVEEGRLYVLENDEYKYIPYTFSTNPSVETNYTDKDSLPRTLADDEYWVLGDNRAKSRDCVTIDMPIKRENLIGVLVAIEGRAELKTKYYYCKNCGKKYDKSGSCEKCHISLSIEYDLIHKRYHWPTYF